MRPDMHEVVIERPRGGPRRRIAPRPYRWRHDDEEDVPRVWKNAGSRTRGFSDLLGPLRRFLRRSVGRRWDDVYGELRSGIAPRSVVHLHILQHLDHLVTLPHQLDPTDSTRTLHGWRVRGAYVCPDTGLLQWRERSYRELRDVDGWVHLRTFLSRRVGRPWAEVVDDAARLAPRPVDVPHALGDRSGPHSGAFTVVDGVLRHAAKRRK